jgi:flagellar hook-basal body complex protein FliE
MKIDPNLSKINPLQKKNNEVSPGGPSFSERMKSAVSEVNNKQHFADKSIQGVIQNKVGIHEGMLAIQEADISFRLLVQVRAKAMEAYKEIIHMPV